MLTHN
jgi:large repetitive protein